MKLYLFLFRRWFDHLVGGLVCWRTGRHVELWESGVTAWRCVNTDPDAPSNGYWERTYCIRCGVTLKEGTP